MKNWRKSHYIATVVVAITILLAAIINSEPRVFIIIGLLYMFYTFVITLPIKIKELNKK